MPKPSKHIIRTEKAPKAIGPYSAGVKTDHFIFTAGQLGIIPESGNIIEGGIENETRQALTNIQHILEEAGSSLSWVVKTTVFLKNMDEFLKMNPVYPEFFKENHPARTTVQVAALPKNADVEIEAIAAGCLLAICRSKWRIKGSFCRHYNRQATSNRQQATRNLPSANRNSL